MCISHANLLHQAAEVLSREDDVVLTFSTIYWISGVIVLLAGAIKGYQRIITTDTFSPELFLEMISEHRVSTNKFKIEQYSKVKRCYHAMTISIQANKKLFNHGMYECTYIGNKLFERKSLIGANCEKRSILRDRYIEYSVDYERGQ